MTKNIYGVRDDEIKFTNFLDYLIVKLLRYFTLYLYHAVPSTWYELNKNAFIKTSDATVQTLYPNRKQT